MTTRVLVRSEALVLNVQCNNQLCQMSRRWIIQRIQWCSVIVYYDGKYDLNAIDLREVTLVCNLKAVLASAIQPTGNWGEVQQHVHFLLLLA